MEPIPAPHSATKFLPSMDSFASKENSLYSSAAVEPLALTKLRLMCSYGGLILPRPHDKSLCYVGGVTRIVVVDRHTTLQDLTHRLCITLLGSSSSSTAISTGSSFTLKYQVPSQDLDSLISVTTDEDLENMIEEYERLESSSAVNKSLRLRLFIFPTKPESVSSIGSLLDYWTKSEDCFLNALNGTTSGFSDASSVNCLLGLDDEVSVPEKKDVKNKGVICTNLGENNPGQDVHSVPDSPMMTTTSSFGSASSIPSLANLPLIMVDVDDHPKVVGGGIAEQFSQMSVQKQHHKHQDDGGFVSALPPVVVSGPPTSSSTAIPEHPNRVISYDERSEHGLQMTHLKHQQGQQQQQHQFQGKQSTGFDLASPDSVLSNGTITDPLSREKPSTTYQGPIVQIHSFDDNNEAADLNNYPDPSTRIQMQDQRQQTQDSAYFLSMPTTQADAQHPRLNHQRPQLIQTAVLPPHYIHRSPYGEVPVACYYHPHHPAMNQQNLVYYMPTRQPPQGYNFPLQQQQEHSHEDVLPATTRPPNNQAPPPTVVYTTTRNAQPPKSELPAGAYRTTNSDAPQLVQVPSSQQQQSQPQYAGCSQIPHLSQPVASAAFSCEFFDPSRMGQHIYYAAQPLPPQSAAQYQTTRSTLPVEDGSRLPTDDNMKHQQVRTAQP